MKRFLIPIFLLLFISSCGTKDNNISTDLVNNSASASSNENKKKKKITFEVTEHDFGKMIQGEQVSYTYKFKNTGNAPLIISGVEETCGGADTKFPRSPLKPGEEGYVSITYDSKGHKGFQNKRVIVKANTNPSETILKFKARVETIDNF